MSRAKGLGGRIVVAAIALAAIGAGLFGAARARDPSAGAATVEFSGVIEATEVDLRVQSGGEAIRVPFDEGAAVTAGALICALDPRKLDQEVAAAEAGAAEARARLRALEDGSRPEEKARARARVALEEALLRDAERERRLARELRESNVASPDALEQAENRVLAARASLEVARRDLDLVLAGARAEDIAAARAAADAAASGAEHARLRRADLEVRSPLEGRLVERFVEPGEVVPAGGLVATLADLSRLRVKVYVGERQLGRVRIGTPALVFVDAYPGRPFPGTVTRLASEAEFTPRSLQTKADRVKLVYETTVEVANPDGSLLSGMPCDVRLSLSEGP